MRRATDGSGAARLRPLRREQGIALVLALWLTIMLTVIATGFTFAMRNEALAARNALSVAQARAAADGAVERVVYELSRPRTKDAWTSDGRTHRWQDGDMAIVAFAVDEAARIDLNSANETLLRSLFTNLGGVDAETAAHLADAVQDWRDGDDLRRPNGAELPDYQAAGRNYGPGNAPFDTVGELARVLGMTPAIFARVAPALTVHSRQPGINPMTASRDVLLALPNASPEAVDAFIAQRLEALDGGLAVPLFPAAQGFSGGPVPVWRIHVEATAPDGVTFVREAVVRPSGEPRRPMIVLLWQEVAAVPLAPAPADGKAGADRPTPGALPSAYGRS
jgi:general secretion pathway protein K